jgi:hypothetical protein
MVADSCGYLEHLPASFSPGRDVVATNENIGQAKNIFWTEGLVRLCASRWGTEPEGWYVDLSYAVSIGVNYSPKVKVKISAQPRSCQQQNTIPRRIFLKLHDCIPIPLYTSDVSVY